MNSMLLVAQILSGPIQLYVFEYILLTHCWNGFHRNV